MKNKKNKSSNLINIFIILLILNFLLNQAVFAQEQETTQVPVPNKIKLHAVLTPPYVIGPGDKLAITDRTLREVFGQVEQYQVTVSADGYISIPLPDGTQENILAAGYTLNELSNEVRSLFGKTLINPLVFIQISEYRPINVYIGGEVVKPGVYKIETTTTTEEGGSTSTGTSTFGLSITQAIQLAGGLKPRADIKAIKITRGTTSDKKIIDLSTLLTGEDVSQDVNLQPGDAIFISAAENPDDQAQNHVRLLGKIAYQEMNVSVVGEVNGGGSFTLPNDATILDAIGSAHGLNTVGTLKRIKLSRFDKDGIYRTAKINVDDLIKNGASFEEISLRPGDKIELLASKGKVTANFLKHISSNSIATILGASAASFGQFAVQDSLLDRINRGAAGSRRNGTGSGGTSITILERKSD